MSKRAKTTANKAKSCLLLDKMPNLLILHQLAPFIEFTKLSLLSRANKQLHNLIGFLFNLFSYWIQTTSDNPIKVYFSRITQMQPVKCMYWDVIDLVEYFINIKTLDLTQYWTSKDIMWYPKFTGTLITSMDYSFWQVQRQLNTFSNITELVLLGKNTPKNDEARFDMKISFIFDAWQFKLPRTMKTLKILPREKCKGVFEPTLDNHWAIHSYVESLEFDYPIAKINAIDDDVDGFYNTMNFNFPSVTKITDSEHIFSKEGTVWYYATHEKPEQKEKYAHWLE